MDVEPRVPEETAGERAARAGLFGQAPLLAVLAITFFLPFVRSCDTMTTAARECADGVVKTIWIAPPFAAAALLAVVIAAALLVGPSRRLARAALAAPVLALPSPILYVGSIAHEGTLRVWPVLAVPAAAIALGAIPWFFLRRAGAWRRIALATASLGALAIPHTFWVVPEIVGGRTENVGLGGWLYLAAVVGIVGISGWALRPRRRLSL